MVRECMTQFGVRSAGDRAAREHVRDQGGRIITAQAFTLLEELGALPVVGMDCVEVAPVHDHQELTSLATAQRVWTWLSGRVKAMPS